jgi:hypothetical protein
VCPRALSLVWSAGDSFCSATSSPSSQSQSSTNSRTFSKERGRETRHTRQHASLPSLRVAGGTYLRLVRARVSHKPSVRSEGERHVTHASSRLCPLCMPGGTFLRLVRARAGRYVATRIPPLTSVPPRPLSCVVRRVLNLGDNELAAFPESVFNRLTNLK